MTLRGESGGRRARRALLGGRAQPLRATDRECRSGPAAGCAASGPEALSSSALTFRTLYAASAAAATGPPPTRTTRMVPVTASNENTTALDTHHEQMAWIVNTSR